MSAEPFATVPPDGMRDRVLASALTARRPGRATPQAPVITPLEAYRRSAESLRMLLSELTDGEWRRPALRGLDVQGLIGHLIGVEHDLQCALDGDQAVATADHIRSTQPAAEAQAGHPPARTLSDWSDAVAGTLARAGAVPAGTVVLLHGTRFPVESLAVVRAFELWTHENDIRVATGRPASAPDASTLTLMTALAVRLLPLAVARSGVPGAALRLVLTGAGGGTWQLPVGDATPDAAGGDGHQVAVGIIADATAFCRLVANRLAPSSAAQQITGDVALAARILQAATTLALD